MHVQAWRAPTGGEVQDQRPQRPQRPQRRPQHLQQPQPQRHRPQPQQQRGGELLGAEDAEDAPPDREAGREGRAGRRARRAGPRLELVRAAADDAPGSGRSPINRVGAASRSRA